MRSPYRLLLVALLTAVAFPLTVHAQSRLMRFSDVHDNNIVFTYEDDLWLASADGSDVRRITRHDGSEIFAKFSPDGSQLAFTAEYDGGMDIYIMPATGGAPRRLTYHPSADLMLDWYPDGKHLLFRSRRVYPTRTECVYRISVDGGMPEALPLGRAGLSAISPDGTSIIFNRISREFRTWKRYQGGMAQDLWMGNIAKGDFEKITDWDGTDNFPMWDESGIYFVSDRKYGTLNLYKFDPHTGQTIALTEYQDYDVKYPSIGPNAIVYQYAESLYVLDLNTGTSNPIAITIPSDQTLMHEYYVNATDHMGTFGLSPTGVRMLLETRGEIINVPVKEGEPINLTGTSGSREKGAVWSPDGRWIAFLSDKTGEEEIYLTDQTGLQPWKQLTKGGKGFRMNLVWSPDSKWLLFTDKFMKLNLVNAETGVITEIDHGDFDDAWERWGIQDFVWSPDSRYIAYTKMEGNLNESIFLHSLAQQKSYRVTGIMTTDWSPSFDPTGQYLYFLSNRTYNPIMCFVDQNHIFLEMARPYMVLLHGDAASPFLPEVAAEEIKGEEAKEGEPDEADSDDDSDQPLLIATENFERRTLVVPNVPAGNYFRLEAVDGGFLYLKKEGNEFLKYQTVTDTTGGRVDLYYYKLGCDNQPQKLMSGINNYHLSADGKKLLYKSGSTFGAVASTSPAGVGDGRIGLGNIHIMIDRQAEFLQMFNEAWRIQRDWFYDPGMHGVDWDAVAEKYRQLVPFCGQRSDLKYLIGEMIAELNAGHTYSYGGESKEEVDSIPTGLLGAEFEQVPDAGFYRISRIVQGENWDESLRSPLLEPGCPIRIGDYLIAIDGQEIPVGDNVYRHLEQKRGNTVTISYNTTPSADGAKQFEVRTIGYEGGIRYHEWVKDNRSKVAAASKGKIGYVHIPDMGEQGCIEFAKAFFAQHNMPAMIIDIRYNRGGFVGDMLIDRLERQLWAITQPREGMTIRDPERCFHGHLVVIMNEDTSSNGEYFAEAIKLKGLATVIGMRTWGGAVGMEAHQDLVDGGVVTPPQFAPFGLDGHWLIEGRGVIPHLTVQNEPGDVVRGIDKQLDTAIKFLLDQIEKDPMKLPNTPPYPNKSKQGE